MMLLGLLITKVLRGYRETSGKRIVVNCGKIIVDLITCFGNCRVLSEAYG